MFGRWLERPLVAAYALNQYPRLIAMFDKELDCCKVIFDKHVQTLEDLGESPNSLGLFSKQFTSSRDYWMICDEIPTV